MLLSFAASVVVTRVFLQLTGFPKIGGGDSGLHIAHVLWGGLLLFVGTLLPLIFVNRWVYPVTAILSGVGVGLFIDEVGKFITDNNDYFIRRRAVIYGFPVDRAVFANAPPTRCRYAQRSLLRLAEPPKRSIATSTRWKWCTSGA
jgi:hypothetical protein